MEQSSAKYHSLAEQDSLYIETEKQNLKFYIGYVLISKVKECCFELKAVDDSSIDFIQSYTIMGVRKFDSFAVYDNVADGNRFLFLIMKVKLLI